jgi:hypothetical protein
MSQEVSQPQENVSKEQLEEKFIPSSEKLSNNEITQEKVEGKKERPFVQLIDGDGNFTYFFNFIYLLVMIYLNI